MRVGAVHVLPFIYQSSHLYQVMARKIEGTSLGSKQPKDPSLFKKPTTSRGAGGGGVNHGKAKNDKNHLPEEGAAMED